YQGQVNDLRFHNPSLSHTHTHTHTDRQHHEEWLKLACRNSLPIDFLIPSLFRLLFPECHPIEPTSWMTQDEPTAGTSAPENLPNSFFDLFFSRLAIEPSISPCHPIVPYSISRLPSVQPTSFVFRRVYNWAETLVTQPPRDPESHRQTVQTRSLPTDVQPTLLCEESQLIAPTDDLFPLVVNLGSCHFTSSNSISPLSPDPCLAEAVPDGST
ncbi:hypothetical protein LSH36_172g01015, partial [Paralvinella palmiformis]